MLNGCLLLNFAVSVTALPPTAPGGAARPACCGGFTRTLSSLIKRDVKCTGELPMATDVLVLVTPRGEVARWHLLTPRK
jgi:hypothetical protein